MRIIVTGSEGFIGKNLMTRLIEQDHEVYGWDIKSGRDLFKQSRWGFDVVYHLACVNQQAALKNPANNLHVNAGGTHLMAKLCARYNSKLIYTSTASVYGASDSIPTPVDADIKPQTDYAVAKLAGEYFVKNSGCDYEIYRLSNVFGPGQTLDNPYCGVIGRFIEQALDGKPLTIVGKGTQTRDFTYIDDVIDILVREKSANNFIRNISTGIETSPLALVAYLSEIMGKKLDVEYIADRGIDGINRRRLITNERCPTPIYEGLEKTVEWFRAQPREGSTNSSTAGRPTALSR